MNLAFITLLVGTSIAASAAQVPGVSEKEVTIGNHSVQSGPFAAYGIIQRVMKAYFDMVNEQGGVNGRKINFIVADNGGDGQKALQATKKLVSRNNVFAFVANSSSGGSQHQSVYKYLQEIGMPDLWVFDNSSVFSEPPNPTTFAFAPTADSEAQFFGEFIAKKFAGKKVGFLYPEHANGRSELAAFKKALNGKLEFIAEQIDVRGDPAAKAEILKLKQAGVEVVYTCTPVTITPAAMKFAAEQGFKPKWILGIANTPRQMFDLLGAEAMEGVISWHFGIPDTEVDHPAIKKHLEFMKARLPSEKPSITSVSGQSLAELTVETLKRAGKDLTKESLLKAAESFKDWKCTVCRVPNSTGPKKHIFNSTIVPLVGKSGKWIEYKD